ncbi:MAG: ABC transporter ATP-binding protein [Acidimicrobiia bacterium]|nr:ABC transporter ATP-binding protein [Acidimicrobiia bacterium]
MSALKRAVASVAPDTVASLWQMLGRLFGPRRRRLIVHPILGTVIAVSETVSLLTILRLLLLLVEDNNRANLAWGPFTGSLSFGALAGVAAISLLITLLARLAEAQVSARNQAFALRRARSLVIDAWFAADWEHLHAARLGRLQQLLGLNAQQAVIPLQLLSVASVAVISLAIYLVIVVVTAPAIALLFAVVALGSAAALNPLRRRSKHLARGQADLLGDLQLNATSYVQLNRELHVFGVEEAAATRLKDLSSATADSYARLKFIQRMLPSVYQQVLLAAIVGIVVVGRAIDVAAVAFGTAAILAVRSLSYIQQLNSSVQIYVETRPFLEELLDSVSDNRDRQTPRGDAELGPVTAISLHNLGYRYPSGHQALEGINLDLGPGDWLGVIGPSGGGKTTLANTLAGLLSPTTGSLQVNGAAVETYSAQSWTTQLGLLSQEPVLLAATIAENIAFHRPATAEQVQRAAGRAGIDREIEALPEGYATAVGEGHSSLSGGQRQRVALARSLLASPTCLILDEPTSALDAANEALVEQSLLDLSPTSIVIVVSHRDALIRRCNRFIVLEHGRVVAQGDASEVDLVARLGAADA